MSIRVDGLDVEITLRNTGNLYVRVHPPDGRVRVSAPRRLGEDRIRAAIRERHSWIRRHQERIRAAHPDGATTLLSGDLIHLWGVPHRMEVVTTPGRPGVAVTGDRITLSVAADADEAHRRRVLDLWYRGLIRERVPDLLERWEARCATTVPHLTIRRMSTRWGSCNVRTRRITLNSELAARDPRCLEYVLVHEMAHYVEAGHGPRFQAVMDGLLPDWRERRALLNGD